jgi:hypothetical protein
MPPLVTRRQFLKAAGLGAAVLAAGPAREALAQDTSPDDASSGIDFDNELNSYNEIYNYPPLLGRVHPWNRVSIWKGPGSSYGRVRNVYGGQGSHGSYVAPIFRSVRGERYDSRFWSPVWFETIDGYIHSAHLLPCREVFNEPAEIPEEGLWGEITVPECFQHKRPSFVGARYDYDHYKCFYSQVHRVMESTTDDEGYTWYRLYDDIEPERPAWVLARNVRLVAREEFDPISLNTEDKRIEISLNAQTLTCYEGERVVFKTLLASGSSYPDDEGNLHDFRTVEGEYVVERKRPSRRMRGGSDIGLPYDVNGVPWCTYFGGTGAAIHGAYWHNNFGSPRSHGCINVTADAAKWVYRWTAPHLSYDEEYRFREEGEPATRIIVV